MGQRKTYPCAGCGRAFYDKRELARHEYGCLHIWRSEKERGGNETT